MSSLEIIERHKRGEITRDQANNDISKLKWFEDPLFMEKMRNTSYGIVSADVIEQVKESLEFVYPGKWDLKLELGKDIDEYYVSVMYAVIHFEEVNITNTGGDKKTIKDLFTAIKFTFSDNNSNGLIFYPKWLYGIRTTYNITDFNYGYMHSHLHLFNVSRLHNEYGLVWNEFCLGQGEFNHLTTLLRAEGYNNDIFQLLLYQTKTVIEWESLEGTPYVAMGDVISKSTLRDVRELNKIIFYQHIKEECLDPFSSHHVNLDWKIYNKKYSIIDNEKLDRFLLYRGEDPTEYESSSLSRQGVSGEYYSFENEYSNSVRNSVSSIGDSSLTFRGEEYKIKIEEEENIQIIDGFKVHPQIKEYVKNRMERSLNLQKIRDCAVERINRP